jgi:uncharacterized repeat protein (TIGR01451 family)
VNADQLSNKATVTLTFWSGKPGADNILKVVDAEGTGDTSGDWVLLSSSYLAPPGTRYIRLECRLYGAGTVWFDDALIREYIQEPVVELVQVDVPDPVRPGDYLVYTLTYSNTGNSVASNITITNTFDADVTFAGEAVPMPDSGSGQTWVWKRGSLAVDESRQIVITTTVGSPADQSTLLNRVEWGSDQTAARWDVEETGVRNVPILAVVKTDTPDPVAAGESLNYTITYTNSGMVPMTGIFLMEFYPPHTEFITSTPAPGNPPANTFWQMPDLLPGEAQSVTIVMDTHLSGAGKKVFNNVLFDSNETDPVFVEESTVISGTPSLVSMTLSPQTSTIPAEVGKPITKSYQLVNTGSQMLTDIWITKCMLDDWKGSVGVDPAHIGSLAGGASQKVTLTVQPGADEISGTYATQIVATSDQTSAQATARVLVRQRPGVVIEPDNVRYAEPGERVTFTHWVTNQGNFTDTILVHTYPSTSWPISPTFCSLDGVGIGKARQFLVTIDVPPEAQMGDVGGAAVMAVSASGPPSESALDFVVVSPPRQSVFLPLVVRAFVPPREFCNGDFANSLAPCWEVKAPVVRRLCDSGSCFARLGTEEDDDKCEGQIVPSTAKLAQTFTPTATGTLVLSFDYQVHSQDVLCDPYDTLEAYLNGERILQVVAPHDPYGCGVDPLIVSGSVEQPVQVMDGESTTLEFHLINRDTWFNTYADVRNVRITYDE